MLLALSLYPLARPLLSALNFVYYYINLLIFNILILLAYLCTKINIIASSKLICYCKCPSPQNSINPNLHISVSFNAPLQSPLSYSYFNSLFSLSSLSPSMPSPHSTVQSSPFKALLSSLLILSNAHTFTLPLSESLLCPLLISNTLPESFRNILTIKPTPSFASIPILSLPTVTSS
jgi:hypothetical protein